MAEERRFHVENMTELALPRRFILLLHFLKYFFVIYYQNLSPYSYFPFSMPALFDPHHFHILLSLFLFSLVRSPSPSPIPCHSSPLILLVALAHNLNRIFSTAEVNVVVICHEFDGVK